MKKINPPRDLTWEKFGKLTVLSKAKSKGKNSYWLCRCECGNEQVLRRDKLIYGISKECSHCKKQLIQQTIQENKEVQKNYKKKKDNSKQKPITITHGMSKTRIYKIWSKMKARCYNKNDRKHYQSYGARGIRVCDEWKDDFMNFYNWAMENGYNNTLTIDRIDVNGNYEPSNCRWATIEEQNYNKRNTTYINIDNNKYTIKDLSDITGLNKNTIRYIYDRQGEDEIIRLFKPHISSNNNCYI